jgi:nitrate reductase NapE
MPRPKPAAGAAYQEDAMNDASTSPPSTRQEEWRSFLFLGFIMAPLLAVIGVSGYGFFVWMYQLITGHLPTG